MLERDCDWVSRGIYVVGRHEPAVSRLLQKYFFLFIFGLTEVQKLQRLAVVCF